MKLFASLVAAGALGLSMLVAVPTPATAAPYPGTVKTGCHFGVKSKVKRNKLVKIGYYVRTSGNARPTGKITLRVYKVEGNRLQGSRVYYERYHGGKVHSNLGKYKKKGKYAATLQYTAPKGSVYKGCKTGRHTFRIVR